MQKHVLAVFLYCPWGYYISRKCIKIYSPKRTPIRKTTLPEVVFFIGFVVHAGRLGFF
jgi:uncharacterized protein YneF (UPF0154 family)